jgi:intracellular sulfur oxidation DsrE/DsrF family protein
MRKSANLAKWTLLAVMIATGYLTVASAPPVAAQPDAPARPGVVYHISDQEQVTPALRQIHNQMIAMPGVPVAVVGLSAGVRFMLEGAKDEKGNLYAARIEQLVARGAEFYACRNTLEAFGVAENDLGFGVGIVPSGIAAISEYQLEKGYAYIKP